MSGAVQAVVGIVEIAVGYIIDVASYGALSPLGNALILAGTSQLLGYAASLLMNPHRQPLVQVGASYSGTLEPPATVGLTDEELMRIYQAD